VAMELATGKEVKADSKVSNGLKEVATIHTPVFGIDRDQVEARIVKTGFHPASAVYAKAKR